jgi:RNA polymerase sigma-70 factor (ECF subfamily)
MASVTSDHLLIERICAGDAAAWEQLIDRYEGRLLAFVASRLQDRAASEDVVQETFVGFLTSLPHFDRSRDLGTYLFSIAAHKLTDHLRKYGRRPWEAAGASDGDGRPLDELPGHARAASSIALSGERHASEDGRLADALRALIAQWAERGQFERLKCMELLFVRGWPNKEVAARVGITEQAVANYKHQTITQLRRLIRDAGVADATVVELAEGERS